MIYEIHTHDVAPGTLAAAEKKLAEEIEHSGEKRSLVAAWRTEIGPLNRGGGPGSVRWTHVSSATPARETALNFAPMSAGVPILGMV